MSKELTKFQSEYDKKIKPKLKPLSSAEIANLSKRISIAVSNAQEGENYLTESLVAAHKAGVTGTSLADYMKVKEFKEGYTLYKKATEQVAKELNQAIATEKEAKALQQQMAKLLGDIAKDLKKRDKKSASKPDIEALETKLNKDAGDIKDALKVYERRNPMTKNYVAKFPKTVQSILKTSASAAKSAKDNTELPQMLQDRNLNSNTNKIVGFKKTVDAKCADALKAAESDIKGAAAPLKDAAVAFKGMKTLVDAYVKIRKDKKMSGLIDSSKDKAKILKTLTAFDKVYAESERKLRGTSTTIKKAG